MEANIVTDWSINALLPKTVHLIEIDSITSDPAHTHVTLNGKICHAKLDTGALINVMKRVSVQTHRKYQQVTTIPKVRCEIGWLWK